jgi:hypothetical protein
MTTDWQEIVSRIAPLRCNEIDDLLETEDAEVRGGEARPPMLPPAGVCGRPAPALWPKKAGAGAHVGVRVDSTEIRAPDVALQLAAAAAERGILPVILSAVPQSGFEEFGFRVERLPPADDPSRSVIEEELRAFWDISVVIDASDVEGLR